MDNKKPIVEFYDENNRSEVMETCKIRMLTKIKRIKLPNRNVLPRLTESVEKNLRKIVDVIHGAYSKKEDIISSICIKLNVPEEDMNLNFHKLCDKERRIGDTLWRWYVKDRILSYLDIDESNAILMMNDKEHGESRKTRERRETLQGKTPFKNFRCSSVSKNFSHLHQNFQEEKSSSNQFSQFPKTQESMTTTKAVKGSNVESDITQNLADLTNNPEKPNFESIEETHDAQSDNSEEIDLEIRSGNPNSVAPNPFTSQNPSNKIQPSETSEDEYLYF